MLWHRRWITGRVRHIHITQPPIKQLSGYIMLLKILCNRNGTPNWHWIRKRRFRPSHLNELKVLPSNVWFSTSKAFDSHLWIKALLRTTVAVPFQWAEQHGYKLGRRHTLLGSNIQNEPFWSHVNVEVAWWSNPAFFCITWLDRKDQVSCHSQWYFTFVLSKVPIALCNGLRKIIDKVLTVRPKVILRYIISANQSAFILRRSILDNIIRDSACFKKSKDLIRKLLL